MYAFIIQYRPFVFVTVEGVIMLVIFSLFIPAVFKVHLSVILTYINSQNTAVYSGISYQ